MGMIQAPLDSFGEISQISGFLVVCQRMLDAVRGWGNNPKLFRWSPEVDTWVEQLAGDRVTCIHGLPVEVDPGMSTDAINSHKSIRVVWGSNA